MSHGLAGRIPVHATAIVPCRASLPFGAEVDSAVLLLGDSGSGKSGVALRLVGMGAKLLADDQVLLSVESGRLRAEPPQMGHGHIEIRGIGILKLPASGPAPVLFCVRLSQEATPRMPEKEFFHVEGLQIALPPRLFRLNGLEAAAPALIAAAAAALQNGALLPEDGSFFQA